MTINREERGIFNIRCPLSKNVSGIAWDGGKRAF